ncbi:MAG: guanylate kinase [Candidatus Veblenbacteria bacterium]|nr:guanylate kinase [Candidatus Veblenbacteria bacterium]
MKRLGTLFIISGTSQAGKSTVARALVRERALKLTNIRTNTTRPRRAEDKQSRQYHFHSVPEFKRLIAQGELLEWARVHGFYYGTPRRAVERALARGRNVTLVIDYQGARQVKRLKPEAITIFISAGSPVQVKRLIMASTHVPASQKLARWRSAQKEFKAMREYDYRIMNRRGQLDETLARVRRIIIQHSRRQP